MVHGCARVRAALRGTACGGCDLGPTVPVALCFHAVGSRRCAEPSLHSASLLPRALSVVGRRRWCPPPTTGALQHHVHESQRLLGKKTLENEMLRDVLELAAKNGCFTRPCWRGTTCREGDFRSGGAPISLCRPSRSGLGPGIDRMPQDLRHRVVGRWPPLDLAQAAVVASDERQLQRLILGPKQHLPGAPEFLELVEQQADDSADALVGVDPAP